MKTSYRIPEANLDGLQERIALLNKRAAKLSVPPVVLTITGSALVPKVNARGETHNEYGEPYGSKTVILVDLDGETPKLAGWEFIATLDHGSEAGVILRTIPGAVLPESYRTATNVCDHCGTARNRTETFVVKNEAGTFKQVGRQCVADFLGGADPKRIASWATMLGAFATLISEAEEEGFFEGGRGRSNFSLSYFTTVAVAMIEKHGFLGKAKAREIGGSAWATADKVTSYLYERDPAKRAEFEIEPTEAHKVKAAAVIEWAATLRDKASRNDYEHNLMVVMGAEALAPKNAGIAASAVTAYSREIERTVARERRAVVESASVHFGTVGKRETFTLTILACIETAGGQYGPTFIYKMADPAGNIATWFSSRQISDLTPGTTWAIKATVKAHETFRGVNQTILTRGAPGNAPIAPEPATAPTEAL